MRLNLLSSVNLGNLHMDQGRYEEAQAHYEAPPAIDREAGSGSHEGIVLGNMGVQQKRGRFAQAGTCQQTIALAREAGKHRPEGFALGVLGDLLAAQGRIGEALETLHAGGSILRELGDALELAKLLCMRGRVDVSAGDIDAAARRGPGGGSGNRRRARL